LKPDPLNSERAVDNQRDKSSRELRIHAGWLAAPQENRNPHGAIVRFQAAASIGRHRAVHGDG